MANQTYLNFKIADDITGKMDSVCETINKAVKNLMEKTSEICRETNYAPIVDAVQDTFGKLSGEVNATIIKELRSWKDEHGYVVTNKGYWGGEESAQTAANMDEKISQAVESLDRTAKEFSLSVATDVPSVDPKHFETLVSLYETCRNTIRNDTEDTLRHIQQKNEDDITYGVALPMFQMVIESYTNYFDGWAKKMGVFRDQAQGLGAARDQANREFSQQAAKTSMSAQQITETLKMFEDVM